MRAAAVSARAEAGPCTRGWPGRGGGGGGGRGGVVVVVVVRLLRFLHPVGGGIRGGALAFAGDGGAAGVGDATAATNAFGLQDEGSSSEDEEVGLSPRSAQLLAVRKAAVRAAQAAARAPRRSGRRRARRRWRRRVRWRRRRNVVSPESVR